MLSCKGHWQISPGLQPNTLAERQLQALARVNDSPENWPSPEALSSCVHKPIAPQIDSGEGNLLGPLSGHLQPIFLKKG